VVYLDSGSVNHKDYTEIKGVLDKAFNGFVAKADCPIKKQKKNTRMLRPLPQNRVLLPQAGRAR
jgi:hypothetical protein